MTQDMEGWSILEILLTVEKITWKISFELIDRL